MIESSAVLVECCRGTGVACNLQGHRADRALSAVAGADPMPTPKTPRISVIIPAYNVGVYVDACLRGLVAQSLADWNAIVIDDGSLDDTRDAIEGVPDPRIRCLRQDHSGAAAARNHGLELASGEFVMYLDADDILHPTALARLLAAIEAAPETVAAYGPYRFVTDTGHPHPRQGDVRRPAPPSGDVVRHLLADNFIGNGGQVLVRMDPRTRALRFKSSLKMAQDWEYWCRLALCGDFVFIDDDLEVLYFRERANSVMRTMATDIGNYEKCIAEIFGNPDLLSRFGRDDLARLRSLARANTLWAAGRENFRHRRCAAGRRFMLRSLAIRMSPWRLLIYVASYPCQWFGLRLVRQLIYYDFEKNPTT